ncbi:MAG: LysR family transcriptional regulator [Lachnoclostridium edouardi]|uniref:LysR family transcriptional regulator n=1 Tax=Lachnoclostridium edouardi TaxID=1926283 RepID=UPI0026DC5269|nr:LysR family transcriptional regulator [Lachnoclostridium edouardi]MDO4279386.1 LysR family transcriptional regulator [Lachnoclostridium edouardi]
MELRVLQYFLAVAREQSVSGAAEYLHLSQPTLSRQLKDLEEEFGKQLFIRGNRKITLTEEGMILRKRAEEIMDLVQKTEQEITSNDEIVVGDIHIGAGETDAIRILAKAARQLQKKHPGIRIHIASGDSVNVTEELDKGLIDFGILFDPKDLSKYNHLKIPKKDTWGVLMLKDAPLAQKEAVRPEDLWDKPLILSRQHRDGSALSIWLNKSETDLNIVATYNLLYNGSILVSEGIGYAITLDKIINTQGSNLCFRPLTPSLQAGLCIVWKKYQVFTKAAQLFLQALQENLSPDS